MSASREKKARQERGSDFVSPKEQKSREEQKSARRYTTIFAICAALFLAFVIGAAVWNSGTLQRNADAVSVNGNTYSAGDVSYFYSNTRSSLLSSAGSLIDSSKSLRKQTFIDGEQTWFDYIAGLATDSLANAALTAQAAQGAGFDGGEELERELSESAASLESAASSYGYTVPQYLKAVFGPLMTRDIFDRNLRMVSLAEAYTTSLADVSNYTEAELIAERDADPDSYDAVAVRHILVDDEETANSLLEQWKAGEATEDSFAALAAENSTDTGSVENGGLYEDVLKGDMVAEFEDWIFDDARRPGDTGVVETTYGYHVMYFVSRGLYSDWQTRAASYLAADALSALTENAEVEQLPGMKYIDN